MTDYEKAMLHIELAFTRVRDALRRNGETCIEDAFHAMFQELDRLLAEENRQASLVSQDEKAQL